MLKQNTYIDVCFDDFTKEIFVFLHSDWSKVHFRLDTSSTEIYLAHVSIFSIVSFLSFNWPRLFLCERSVTHAGGLVCQSEGSIYAKITDLELRTRKNN